MNESSSYKTQPLQMIAVAKESIAFILDNYNKIFNSIKNPCALTIIISLFTNPKQEKMDLYWAVMSIAQMYLYILIVVRLHRIFLLDEAEYSLRGSFIWKNINTSYFITSIALGIMATFIAMPIMFIILSFLGDYDVEFTIFITILFVPVGYLLSRLSLVLPSIAINDRIDFRESWDISTGNGWKVFILITLIPIVFNAGIEHLYFENIALRPIYSLLGIVVLLVEVVILSNTYKNLISPNKNMCGKT